MIKLVIFDVEHVLYNADEQVRYFSMKLAEFAKKNDNVNMWELPDACPRSLQEAVGLWSAIISIGNDNIGGILLLGNIFGGSSD